MLPVSLVCPFLIAPSVFSNDDKALWEQEKDKQSTKTQHNIEN
jgi:hypothetical protein